MFRAIQEFFDTHIRSQGDAPGDEQQHTVRLATAALLIEMSRADFEVKPDERDAVIDAVQRIFGLPPEETHELIALAEQEASEAASLYEFTRLIDNNFTPAQKQQVVEMLWRVAFADSHKDAHEEHLVRKIAGLLHVAHQDFIRARHKVEEEMASGNTSS